MVGFVPLLSHTPTAAGQELLGAQPGNGKTYLENSESRIRIVVRNEVAENHSSSSVVAMAVTITTVLSTSVAVSLHCSAVATIA